VSRSANGGPPDHRARLREALAALAPVDDGFAWFGEPVRGRHGAALTDALRDRLFADYYSRGVAVPGRDPDVPSPWPDDLRPGLRAVRRAVAVHQPGWTVCETGTHRVCIERDGLRLWVRPTDLTRQGPDPGDDVTLVTPGDMSARSPGHHVVLGARGLRASEVETRIYWNIRPEGADALIAELTGRLDVDGIPHCVKVLADGNSYERADAGVLYLRAAESERAARIACIVADRLAGELREGVPALTLTLGPGLAYAQEPDAGKSFGLHRCGLIAEGVERAWARGATAPDECLASVESVLAGAGIDLDRPHRTVDGPPDPTCWRGRAPRPSPPSLTAVDTAEVIGERLRRSALWHEGRCSWIGPATGPGDRPGLPIALRGLDPTLYRGTAGVGLFLGELHAVTGDARLRNVARGALRHAIAGIPRNAGGFHAGAAGVAYAATRGARLLGDEELHAASRALRPDRDAAATETDLVDGLAGTALGLTMVGDVAPEALSGMADDLLARATVHAAGALSWATGPPGRWGRHLTGMAHGASGVGLALAALAATLGRADLTDASRAAARYRHGAPPGAGPEASPMSWCHGAPGVALARLRSGVVLGDGAMLEDARALLDVTAAAVERACIVPGADCCLCHGLAGNADIVLEGIRTLPDADPAWSDAVGHAGRVLAAAAAGGGRPPLGPFRGSPALMVGEAGVGMFLLRLAEPSVPGVLAAPGAVLTQEETHVGSAR